MITRKKYCKKEEERRKRKRKKKERRKTSYASAARAAILSSIYGLLSPLYKICCFKIQNLSKKCRFT
jgi:hypothetical protein